MSNAIHHAWYSTSEPPSTAFEQAEHLAALNPLPLHTKTTPTPAGYPAIPDTLNKAPTSTPPACIANYEPTKPVLATPSSLFATDNELYKKSSKLSELYYLEEMELFHSFGEQILNTDSIRLATFRSELQDLLQDLQKAAKEARDSGFWSLLTKIANTLLAAVSIVLGTALITTGGGALVGGAMIASGVFSIANMVLSEAGVWDWTAKKLARDEEEKELIAMMIPAVVGVIAGAIGLFGSGSSLIQLGIPELDQIILVGQAVIDIIKGTTTIAEGCSRARITCAQAHVKDIQSSMTVQRQLMDMTTKSVAHVFDILSAAHKQSAKVIELAVRSNQLVTQEIRG